MSEYEPGTVALIDVANRDGEVINRDAIAIRDNDGEWCNIANFGGLTFTHPHKVSNIRPQRLLADDEVAVRANDLRADLTSSWGNEACPFGARVLLRQALEAYDVARTPQVEEPLGLGAVVDAAGVRWVRSDVDEYPWRSADGKALFEDWEMLSRRSPRVLSEGVRLDEEASR